MKGIELIMKKQVVKILTQALFLSAFIPIALTHFNVKITVLKDIVEPDLAMFNLYQDASSTPFASIDATVKPWVWEGLIVVINGKTDITATALDFTGNESEPSPPTHLQVMLKRL